MQQQRRNPAHAELKDSHGLQQEQHAQTNQHDRSHRYLGSVNFLSRAEGLAQTQRIRRRLPDLQRRWPSAPHR